MGLLNQARHELHRRPCDHVEGGVLALCSLLEKSKDIPNFGKVVQQQNVLKLIQTQDDRHPLFPGQFVRKLEGQAQAQLLVRRTFGLLIHEFRETTRGGPASQRGAFLQQPSSPYISSTVVADALRLRQRQQHLTHVVQGESHRRRQEGGNGDVYTHEGRLIRHPAQILSQYRSLPNTSRAYQCDVPPPLFVRPSCPQEPIQYVLTPDARTHGKNPKLQVSHLKYFSNKIHLIYCFYYLSFAVDQARGVSRAEAVVYVHDRHPRCARVQHG